MTIKKACIMLLLLVCAWNINLFYAEEISDSTLNYELIRESADSFKIKIYNTIEINKIINTYKESAQNNNITIEYNDISADVQSSYEFTDKQMDELLSNGQVVITLDNLTNGNIYRVYLKIGDQIIHQLSEEDIINTSISEEQLEGEYIRIGEEPYARTEVKNNTCDIEQMKDAAQSGGIFDGAGCSYIVTEDTELPLVDTNIGTISNMNITFASGVVQDTDAILARTNEGWIEDVVISNPVISLVENPTFGAITNQNDGRILNSRVENADITINYKGPKKKVSACLAAVTNGNEGVIRNDNQYEKGDYTGNIQIAPESDGSEWYISTVGHNYGEIAGIETLIDGTINESTYFSQIAVTNESTGTIANAKVKGYVENEESKLNLEQVLSTKINNAGALQVSSGVVVGNNAGTIRYQDDLYISNIEVIKSYKNTTGILVAVNDGTIELDKDVYISDISGTKDAIYDGFGVIAGENLTTSEITLQGDVEVNGIDLTTIGGDSKRVGSLIGANSDVITIGGNITASDISMATGAYSGGLFGWSSDKYYPQGEGESPDTLYIEVGGYIDMNNIAISGDADYVGGVIGRGTIDILGSKEISDGESSYSVVMQNITVHGDQGVGGIAGELVSQFDHPTHEGWYLNNVTVNGNTNVGGAIGSTYNYEYYNKILSGVKEKDISVTGTINVGGVIGGSEKFDYTDSYEYITVESSEVTGTNAVGAVSGVNKGTISGASIASDVQVIGNERVGTLVGLNEGTVDHSFSSGNIYNQGGELIDSNQREYTNNYVGTLVGQQVNGASLKQSVYDGDSYSNSIYREVGVQQSLEARNNVVNICVEKNYQVNPSMTIGDYDQLLSSGGECEQAQPKKSERRDNYIADNSFVITAGDDYEACVFRYYDDMKDNFSATYIPNCKANGSDKLPQIPVLQQVSNNSSIYDIWHADRPTSENYSLIQLQKVISEELTDSTSLGFGNCWNTDVYPPQLRSYKVDETCTMAMSYE